MLDLVRVTTAQGKSDDRRYGGHFVRKSVLWWATLDSNQ